MTFILSFVIICIFIMIGLWVASLEFISLLHFTSFTPIMLWFSSNRHIQEQRPLGLNRISWKWNIAGFALTTLITVTAYTIFLFEFVLSMGIGVVLGLVFKKRVHLMQPLLGALSNAGKWGL